MSNLKSESSERILLSSVMQGTDLSDGLADQLVSSVTDKQFTTQARKFIFSCIKAIREDRLSPDMDLVSSYTLGNDSQMNTDTPAELALVMCTSVQRNIDALITTVTELQNARELEILSLAISNRLRETESVSTELLEISNDFSKIYTENQVHNSGGYAREYLLAFIENMEAAIKSEEVLGLKLGISALDTSMGGLRGGEVMVLAGLPGMGKTSWLVTIIARMILKGEDIPVMFSIEMTTDEMIGRLAVQIARLKGFKGLKYHQIRNPSHHTKESRASLKKASEIIYKSKFYIDDSSRTSIEDIRATCFKLKRDGKIGVVCVDYLQLMVKDDSNATSELATITGELKRISKEFNVPIIELAQLNVRDCGKGRPNMGNLKGSSSIEQNADAIFFSWREYAITKEGDPSDLAIIHAKGRGFDSNDIKAHFCTQSLAVLDNDSSEKNGKDNSEVYRGEF